MKKSIKAFAVVFDYGEQGVENMVHISIQNQRKSASFFCIASRRGDCVNRKNWLSKGIKAKVVPVIISFPKK